MVVIIEVRLFLATVVSHLILCRLKEEVVLEIDTVAGFFFKSPFDDLLSQSPYVQQVR